MEIYNTKPLTSHPDKSFVLTKQIDKIEFQNVSFGYEPSHLVLKDVSFELHAGKTLAIVGPTGSGKSTISSLLFKFYNAHPGTIFVNNKDIQEVNTESLYNLLGIVPQDVILFNTTIYENILYARPNALKEEVEEAIELAQLGSVLLKLPHHYDTVVEEG